MNNNVVNAISELRGAWAALNIESISKIKSILQALAKNQKVNDPLSVKQSSPESLELYRDQKEGFVLLEYIEQKDYYRLPHDHGRAWVIYVVASGEVEMANYFNATRPDGGSHLVLKSREQLVSGDARIYYPGEIHDTRCISEVAHILRFTSLDLKDEERIGHMRRYQT